MSAEPQGHFVAPSEAPAPEARSFGALDRWIGLGFALLFALFVAVSWAKWPLLTADSARELYVPFQIQHGALIYQDFHYLYGPVAPYLQAGLLSLFGERLEVLYVASLAQLAVVMGLLYALARQLLAPWLSAAVLFLFFTHFALGRDIGGYVWPYSFAATFGVLFGLATLVGLARYLATGRLGWLGLAGAMIGVSVVTKLEYGFAAAATSGLFLLGSLVLRPWLERARPWWAELVAIVAPAGAVAGAVAAFVLSRMPLSTVLESVWPTALMKMWDSAGRWHGTSMTWAANLKLFALELVVLGLIASHGQLWRWARAGGSARWGVLAGLAALAGAAWVGRAGLAFYAVSGLQYWMGPSFLLLFGLLGAVVFRLARSARDGGRIDEATVLWGLIAAYGCLVAARTLMTGYNDYTRYQAPVALIAWVAFAAVWLPGWLRSRGWLADERRTVTVLLTGIVALLGGLHLASHARDYLAPHVGVSGKVGTVMAQPAYGLPFNQALSYVRSRLRPGEAIVAAPMEASFYLFTGRENVLKEDQLFYGYLTTREEQAAAIRRMRDQRVRYVLVSSYGLGGMRFGETFMQDLGSWLRAECRLVAEYGDDSYRVRIYEVPAMGPLVSRAEE